MVKIYFKKSKEKYVDISIWSLLKANVLSSLLLIAIIYGSLIALIVIMGVIERI